MNYGCVTSILGVGQLGLSGHTQAHTLLHINPVDGEKTSDSKHRENIHFLR